MFVCIYIYIYIHTYTHTYMRRGRRSTTCYAWGLLRTERPCASPPSVKPGRTIWTPGPGLCLLDKITKLRKQHNS